MFISCSVKISFQGQRNPQRYKNPKKLFHLSREIFCKLYTLSRLIIYTFTVRYSLAIRAFPDDKYSIGSKFHFF